MLPAECSELAYEIYDLEWSFLREDYDWVIRNRVRGEPTRKPR